ncbi:uroporphyrinogen-III synthase [Trueperella bialowiezensis]|uniref:Uroporphyrinogen-III synthase n=1 Tax=Trueperella bialowiezensis TaxID=312285 RepID=A0A448PEN6_9ACTO|nr:uroporphyrinogen-III synthase [Trueperella bialowiezensis]VEI13387.1 uroporphyrinogen-III synthase [Trueperella bialowiezensis]
MKIAATRAPSQLTEGWISIPVTRRVPLPEGIARLREAFTEIAACCDDEGRREKPVRHGADAAAGHWLAVTSGYTFTVLAESGLEIPQGMPIACVGQATARRAPRSPQLIAPAPSTAAQLAVALVAAKPRRVTFPASALAATTLTDSLAAAGIPTTRIDIYTSEPSPEGVRKMAAERPDVVVVTSSSAGRTLAEHWPGDLPLLVAIGQPTADTLTSLGAPPAGVAATPDRRGIEDCLETLERTHS